MNTCIKSKCRANKNEHGDGDNPDLKGRCKRRNNLKNFNSS